MRDADAREIVQDVLMSAATAIDRFDLDAVGSFRGWLSQITRNATIDRLRKLAARHETIDASGVLRKLDEAAGNDQSVGDAIQDEFEQDRRELDHQWHDRGHASVHEPRASPRRTHRCSQRPVQPW